MLTLLGIERGKNSQIRRCLIGFPGQIWTNHRPTFPGVHSFKQNVGRKEKLVRIERRKYNRQGAIVAVFSPTDGLRRNVGNFAELLIGARQTRAVNNVGVERIYSNVAIFKNSDRMPFAKSDLAIIAAAQRSRRAAFLLRAIYPIGKAIVS